MASVYYKNVAIKDSKFYKIPNYIYVDFSDIPGRELVIQEGDRLDIIAEQVYGNPEYWRAIAIYNNVGYFFDIKPGVIIKLPEKIQDVLDRL